MKTHMIVDMNSTGARARRPYTWKRGAVFAIVAGGALTIVAGCGMETGSPEPAAHDETAGAENQDPAMQALEREARAARTKLMENGTSSLAAAKPISAASSGEMKCETYDSDDGFCVHCSTRGVGTCEICQLRAHCNPY